MAIIDDYSDCPELLRKFLFYMLTIKGRSAKTVNGYYIDLRTFFRFIMLKRGQAIAGQDLKDISILNIDLILIKSITLLDGYEFLNYVMSERKNSAVTRARKISSIKSFFQYLTNKIEVLSFNPMLELEAPSIKKTLPKHLSLEQCYELLKNIDGDFYERDFCIITLFLNCGMRLSELVGLNVSDISDDRIRLLGKGNKERIVYINDACKVALDSYIAYRNNQKIKPEHKKALFLNRNGARIGARRVEQIIEENLNRSGLEQYGYSTHKLRHTAATIMYQNGGVDIRVLQDILGHSNLGTTQIYTHVSSEQIKSAVSSTPLSKIKPPAKKKKEE